MKRYDVIVYLSLHETIEAENEEEAREEMDKLLRDDYPEIQKHLDLNLCVDDTTIEEIQDE